MVKYNRPSKRLTFKQKKKKEVEGGGGAKKITNETDAFEQDIDLILNISD